MNDREKWRERVRHIRAGGTTWWWWWWHVYARACQKNNWVIYSKPTEIPLVNSNHLQSYSLGAILLIHALFILMWRVLYRLNWLIDLNGISACLGLIYAKRLKNSVHFTFIFTFFLCVVVFLTRFYRIRIIFKQIDWIHNVELRVMVMKVHSTFLQITRAGELPSDTV